MSSLKGPFDQKRIGEIVLEDTGPVASVYELGGFMGETFKTPTADLNKNLTFDGMHNG